MKKTEFPKNMGRSCPNGIFYRRACKMMGINPDNNPNYRAEGTKRRDI